MQNSELLEANQKYCREFIWPEWNTTKVVNITLIELYYSGAKKLNNLRNTLWSNFLSHMHQVLY